MSAFHLQHLLMLQSGVINTVYVISDKTALSRNVSAFYLQSVDYAYIVEIIACLFWKRILVIRYIEIISISART